MDYSLISGVQQTLIVPPADENASTKLIHRDFHIKFHGAHNLPKMDIIGTVDPFFRATIDNGQMKYTSTSIVKTSNPVWEEEWIVRNVPFNARLFVKIYDKDDEMSIDDYIGKFEIDLKPIDNELIEILGPFQNVRGLFQLSIIPIPISPDILKFGSYIFDGPVRYFRHYSLAMGHLAQINDERLYSTWKIYLKRIDIYFTQNQKQKYNSSYDKAKSIFEGPMSQTIQSAIKQAHRILYAKKTTNKFGLMNSSEDFWKLLLDSNTNNIKPCVYTYVIEDHSCRFSETGAAFFVDIASKHALHANCAKTVFYAGEFHPRPIGGWDQYDPNERRSWNQWELVIDNNSGTYAPDSTLLENLKELLICNFPGLNVITYDYKDQELKPSVVACRDFAKSPKSKSVKTLEHLISPSSIN